MYKKPKGAEPCKTKKTPCKGMAKFVLKQQVIRFLHYEKLQQSDMRCKEIYPAKILPSKAVMYNMGKKGVLIIYPCLTRRWLSKNWYSHINTDEL